MKIGRLRKVRKRMLTVNELFSGIGSQSAALERLGIDFKVVGIAEIDKYAIKSYEAIHGSVKNYGDISKIEKLDYADFWTYSFPCQDISVAGKQAGINENTRSGLLYEVERLLYKSIMYGEQPKYLMLENVKNLVGKKFKPQFDEWLKRLDELGYNTYWKVLNAKNYGIPQNRERVFAISIRKDIDTGYEFPVGFDNGKRLKDILESEVDEKFYLSNGKVNLFLKQGNVNPSGNGINGSVCTGDICNTLTTNKGEGLKIGIDKSINNPKEIEYANCLTAREDRGVSNHKSEGTAVLEKILIPQATKQGYIECNVPGVADLSFPDSKTRRGRVQENGEICPTLTAGTQDLCYIDLPCIGASRGRNPENPSDRTPGNEVEQRLELNKNGTSNTITTVQKDNYVVEPSSKFGKMKNPYDIANEYFQENDFIEPIALDEQNKCIRKDFTVGTLTTDGSSPKKNNRVVVASEMQDFRIRKLTPLEVRRLMGFTDEQFHKAEQVNSNSQLYKQAGNSIVVDVLYYLFKNLFGKN